jgi:hypothetical protein
MPSTEFRIHVEQIWDMTIERVTREREREEKEKENKIKE